MKASRTVLWTLNSSCAALGSTQVGAVVIAIGRVSVELHPATSCLGLRHRSLKVSLEIGRNFNMLQIPDLWTKLQRLPKLLLSFSKPSDLDLRSSA